MDKFDIPEPKKIAPNLTLEQRQAMAPLDLLVQYIMPKLWDKVNHLEWAVKEELHDIRQTTDERISAIEQRLDDMVTINQRVLSAAQTAASSSGSKAKRGSSKKKTEAAGQPAVPADVKVSEPVAMSAVANYDARTDTWVPKVVEGVEITAKVVREIMSAQSTAGAVAPYPMDAMAFVFDLSESERNTLCATFPD